MNAPLGLLESGAFMGLQLFEDGIYYMAPPDAGGANAIRFLDFATVFGVKLFFRWATIIIPVRWALLILGVGPQQLF